jgi:hypothetical protein
MGIDGGHGWVPSSPYVTEVALTQWEPAKGPA